MLSFIIPAHNEQTWLGRWLSALRFVVRAEPVSTSAGLIVDPPDG
jgi:hypothetical protein